MAGRQKEGRKDGRTDGRTDGPVALDFVAEFLDVAEAPTRVALLLVAMVTVAGHMPHLPAGVAALLPFRLLAVSGDVTAAVAVIAGWGDRSDQPTAHTVTISPIPPSYSPETNPYHSTHCYNQYHPTLIQP